MDASPTPPRIDDADTADDELLRLVDDVSDSYHTACAEATPSPRLEIFIPDGIVAQLHSPGVYPGSPGALEESRLKKGNNAGSSTTNSPATAELLDDQIGKKLNNVDFRFRGLQGFISCCYTFYRFFSQSFVNAFAFFILITLIFTCYNLFHSCFVFTEEREHVQKKTFTKWVNSHLVRVSCKIQDLYMDMRDGKMLLKLLEVLSGERLVRFGTLCVFFYLNDVRKNSS